MSRESSRTRIDELVDAVLEMGELVSDRLRAALTALTGNDAERARTVRDNDGDVNDRYLAVEGRCIEILALEGPVASDLRIVVASFKITTDLERIGDLATNLAEWALATDRAPLSAVDIAGIGAVAAGMVEDALAAYREALTELDRTDGDPAADSDWLSSEVADRDDELDALCAEAGAAVVRSLAEYVPGPDLGSDRAATSGGRGGDAGGPPVDEALVTDARLVLLTVRDLERVGDHAVNVVARTRYMATGSDELLA